MLYRLAHASSTLASVLRLGAGGAPATAPEDGERSPLIIYEFEGCPFCRIAREAVSAAGAPTLMRPCPKGGKRFRPQVREQGGKAQFPFLVDENNGVTLYESADIARYVHEVRGGSRSWLRYLGPANLMLSQLGVLVRGLSGTFAKRSRPPEAPLELFGAERDPAVRLVKERLCAMEIEYLWRPVNPGGGVALRDPRLKEALNGAPAIINHLRAAYSA